MLTARSAARVTVVDAVELSLPATGSVGDCALTDAVFEMLATTELDLIRARIFTVDEVFAAIAPIDVVPVHAEPVLGSHADPVQNVALCSSVDSVSVSVADVLSDGPRFVTRIV